MIYKVIETMFNGMDKASQKELASKIWHNFGEGSITLAPRKKARAKGKKPYWIRRVVEFNAHEKGFAQLGGAWCKAEDVVAGYDLFVVGVAAWAYDGGPRYAVVTPSSLTNSVLGFDISRVKVVKSFEKFKDLADYAKDILS